MQSNSSTAGLSVEIKASNDSTNSKTTDAKETKKPSFESTLTFEERFLYFIFFKNTTLFAKSARDEEYLAIYNAFDKDLPQVSAQQAQAAFEALVHSKAKKDNPRAKFCSAILIATAGKNTNSNFPLIQKYLTDVSGRIPIAGIALSHIIYVSGKWQQFPKLQKDVKKYVAHSTKANKGLSLYLQSLMSDLLKIDKVETLVTAAKAGCTFAQCDHAMLYQSYPQQEAHLLTEPAQEAAFAKYMLGMAYLKMEEFEKAKSLLTEAASAGIIDASYILADLLFDEIQESESTDDNFLSDRLRCAHYFRAAFESHDQAKANHAQEMASELLTECLQHGDLDAAYELGEICFLRGSYDLARNYLKQSLKSTSPGVAAKAQRKLAEIGAVKAKLIKQPAASSKAGKNLDTLIEEDEKRTVPVWYAEDEAFLRFMIFEFPYTEVREAPGELEKYLKHCDLAPSAYKSLTTLISQLRIKSGIARTGLYFAVLGHDDYPESANKCLEAAIAKNLSAAKIAKAYLILENTKGNNTKALEKRRQAFALLDETEQHGSKLAKELNKKYQKLRPTDSAATESKHGVIDPSKLNVKEFQIILNKIKTAATLSNEICLPVCLEIITLLMNFPANGEDKLKACHAVSILLETIPHSVDPAGTTRLQACRDLDRALDPITLPTKVHAKTGIAVVQHKIITDIVTANLTEIKHDNIGIIIATCQSLLTISLPVTLLEETRIIFDRVLIILTRAEAQQHLHAGDAKFAEEKGWQKAESHYQNAKSILLQKLQNPHRAKHQAPIQATDQTLINALNSRIQQCQNEVAVENLWQQGSALFRQGEGEWEKAQTVLQQLQQKLTTFQTVRFDSDRIKRTAEFLTQIAQTFAKQYTTELEKLWMQATQLYDSNKLQEAQTVFEDLKAKLNLKSSDNFNLDRIAQIDNYLRTIDQRFCIQAESDLDSLWARANLLYEAEDWISAQIAFQDLLEKWNAVKRMDSSGNVIFPVKFDRYKKNDAEHCLIDLKNRVPPRKPEPPEHHTLLSLDPYKIQLADLAYLDRYPLSVTVTTETKSAPPTTLVADPSPIPSNVIKRYEALMLFLSAHYDLFRQQPRLTQTNILEVCSRLAQEFVSLYKHLRDKEPSSLEIKTTEQSLTWYETYKTELDAVDFFSLIAKSDSLYSFIGQALQNANISHVALKPIREVFDAAVISFQNLKESSDTVAKLNQVDHRLTELRNKFKQEKYIQSMQHKINSLLQQAELALNSPDLDLLEDARVFCQQALNVVDAYLPNDTETREMVLEKFKVIINNYALIIGDLISEGNYADAKIAYQEASLIAQETHAEEKQQHPLKLHLQAILKHKFDELVQSVETNLTGQGPNQFQLALASYQAASQLLTSDLYLAESDLHLLINSKWAEVTKILVTKTQQLENQGDIYFKAYKFNRASNCYEKSAELSAAINGQSALQLQTKILKTQSGIKIVNRIKQADRAFQEGTQEIAKPGSEQDIDTASDCFEQAHQYYQSALEEMAASGLDVEKEEVQLRAETIAPAARIDRMSVFLRTIHILCDEGESFSEGLFLMLKIRGLPVTSIFGNDLFEIVQELTQITSGPHCHDVYRILCELPQFEILCEAVASRSDFDSHLQTVIFKHLKRLSGDSPVVSVNDIPVGQSSSTRPEAFSSSATAITSALLTPDQFAVKRSALSHSKAGPQHHPSPISGGGSGVKTAAGSNDRVNQEQEIQLNMSTHRSSEQSPELVP